MSAAPKVETPATRLLYVAHSRQDEAWVQGVVLPALGLAEAEVSGRAEEDLDGLKVEDIAQDVQSCRYTLLVASGAARADQWVQFAAGLAEVLSIEEDKPRLLVMARDFDPDSERGKELLPLWQRALTVLDCSTAERTERGLARLAAQLRLAGGQERAEVQCPYPGLRSFGVGDEERLFSRTDLFFGRDEEAGELVEELRRSGRALLIGPSGSGKSSLVRARVVPAMQLPAQAVSTVRPGARPDEALAAAVAALAAPLAEALEGYLADPRSAGAVERLAEAGGGMPRLLVVDPFDDVLTARAASAPSGAIGTVDVATGFATAMAQAVAAVASAQRFAARLTALTKVRGLSILIVLRSDFYPELMRSPLWRLFAEHRVELLPLRGEALREAIVGPAAQSGVHVEVDLVERLVREADEDCAAEALPLLQVALEKLWAARQWRYLSLESYERIAGGERVGEGAREAAGGSRGLEAVLARHADESLAMMSPRQRLLARRVLLDLVHFGDGRPHTRRRRRRRELARSGDEPGALDTLLDALAERRLVVLGRDRALITEGGGEPRRAELPEGAEANDRADGAEVGASTRGEACVDLAHDSLLTGWSALAGWLREYREAILAHRRLEARAQGGGALTAAEYREWARWLKTAAGQLLGAPETLHAMMRHTVARHRLKQLGVVAFLLLVVAFALVYRGQS